MLETFLELLQSKPILWLLIAVVAVIIILKIKSTQGDKDMISPSMTQNGKMRTPQTWDMDQKKQSTPKKKNAVAGLLIGLLFFLATKYLPKLASNDWEFFKNKTVEVDESAKNEMITDQWEIFLKDFTQAIDEENLDDIFYFMHEGATILNAQNELIKIKSPEDLLEIPASQWAFIKRNIKMLRLPEKITIEGQGFSAYTFDSEVDDQMRYIFYFDDVSEKWGWDGVRKKD